MKLVLLPGTKTYVNPMHVVYVRTVTPESARPPYVEVCSTKYCQYMTTEVYVMSAEEVVALLNGASE